MPPKIIGRTLCAIPVFFKIQEGTTVSRLLDQGGKSPLTKSSLTGRYFIQARVPDGTMTTSSTFERPFAELGRYDWIKSF